MWSRHLLVIAVSLLLLSGRGAAQTRTIEADAFRWSAGPCTVTSADGSPDKLIFSVCPYLSTPAGGINLTLGPTGDLIVDPAGNDIFPNLNYDINIGSPQLKFLSLSVGELIAETLVAQDVMATIGGRVIVAPTTLLTGDLSAVATSMTVKHNNLADGDRVYLQSSPGGVSQVEFLAITSGATGSAGAYSYFITRNLDGTGANTWYAGDAVLNTGTTGDGFIDLYSTAGVLSGTGPSIVGNVRTGTTFNSIEPRWAIGNLNGLCAYATDIVGAFFGDCAAANITIDTTNGIRLRHGTTNKILISPAGSVTIIGDGDGITNIDGGHIRTGTINATAIIANSISANEIGGGEITADELAANSVTAIKIVAGTITADKLTVSTLSAISANIGTVTAGTIDGVTINAGSSDEVVLSSSGITITDGTGSGNKIKWSGGSAIWGHATGSMSIYAASGGQVQIGDGSTSRFVSSASSISIGEATNITIDAATRITTEGAVRIGGLNGSGATRVVCIDSSGDLVLGASNTAC